MNQEKVREILSHVDMTKIDLTSFKISEKKFNELSTLYRNRVIISCVTVMLRKNQHPAEEVDVAFEMLTKVIENPELYSYDTLYHMEREAVDKAINDITSRRDRNINDVKVKAIEKRMKDSYKQMRKTLELALEEGNTFEQEFQEETVERCLQVAKEAIAMGKKKAAEQAAKQKAQKSIKECQDRIEECEMIAETRYAAVAASSQKPAISDLPEVVQAEMATYKEQQKTTVKKPFWKRLFAKRT